MAKYIDADLLRKEIERQKSLFSTEKEKEGLSKIDKLSLGARIASLEETIVLIDSLQQEQPTIEEDWVERRKQECGYRRLLTNGIYQCERYEGAFVPCDGRCSWVVDYPKLKELEEMKQPEMDLEKIIEQTYHDGSVVDTDDIDHVTYENIARYFYELRLNTRKEEN